LFILNDKDCFGDHLSLSSSELMDSY